MNPPQVYMYGEHMFLNRNKCFYFYRNIWIALYINCYLQTKMGQLQAKAWCVCCTLLQYFIYKIQIIFPTYYCEKYPIL